MLVSNPCIDKIQLPSSMIKVDKSKSNRPLHKNVVLNIIRTSPSAKQEIMGRIVDDSLKNPTDLQLETLKIPCADVMRVLQCRGVSTDVLDQCKPSANVSATL